MKRFASDNSPLFGNRIDDPIDQDTYGSQENPVKSAPPIAVLRRQHVATRRFRQQASKRRGTIRGSRKVLGSFITRPVFHYATSLRSLRKKRLSPLISKMVSEHETSCRPRGIRRRHRRVQPEARLSRRGRSSLTPVTKAAFPSPNRPPSATKRPAIITTSASAGPLTSGPLPREQSIAVAVSFNTAMCFLAPNIYARRD